MEITHELISKKVEAYAEANLQVTYPEENRLHIINIAKSILFDRHNIITGGGFVQAFNENNLEKTFAKADSTIAKNIDFLLKMSNNINLYN